MRKRCPSCGRTRALSSFYKNKAAKDGLCWECKDCSKARVNAWNERKREEMGDEAFRRHKASLTHRHRILHGMDDEKRYRDAVYEATRKLIGRHQGEYDRLLAAARRRQKAAA